MALRVVRAPGETHEQAVRRALATDAGRRRRAENREWLELRERLRHPPSTPEGECARLLLQIVFCLPLYGIVMAVLVADPGCVSPYVSGTLAALGCAWIAGFLVAGQRVMREWWSDVRAMVADRVRDPQTLLAVVGALLLGPVGVLLLNWKALQ